MIVMSSGVKKKQREFLSGGNGLVKGGDLLTGTWGSQKCPISMCTDAPSDPKAQVGTEAQRLGWEQTPRCKSQSHP